MGTEPTRRCTGFLFGGIRRRSYGEEHQALRDCHEAGADAITLVA